MSTFRASGMPDRAAATSRNQRGNLVMLHDLRGRFANVTSLPKADAPDVDTRIGNEYAAFFEGNPDVVRAFNFVEHEGFAAEERKEPTLAAYWQLVAVSFVDDEDKPMLSPYVPTGAAAIIVQTLPKEDGFDPLAMPTRIAHAVNDAMSQFNDEDPAKAHVEKAMIAAGVTLRFLDRSFDGGFGSQRFQYLQDLAGHINRQVLHLGGPGLAPEQ